MKTNYEKVAEIDGIVIFKDKSGYFIFEHYSGLDGENYAIPVRLGESVKELVKILPGILDWNYRAWHGEMEYILKQEELLRVLQCKK